LPITVSATVKKQSLKLLAISCGLFVTVLLIFIKMKTNEMGGACGTYCEDKRITKRLRVRGHLEDPGIDGKIILRWIFRK
jgi:hypothetical protein